MPLLKAAFPEIGISAGLRLSMAAGESVVSTSAVINTNGVGCRHRSWPEALKLEIVPASLEAGASADLETLFARGAGAASCGSSPSRRWSLDFISDALSDGRRFRILAIVDDFTGECLCLAADTSLSG
jgi:hypothetical protein